ncbi:hypothetical protein FBQ97_00400 [Acidobacteria bacterium ACD]|nr:MAG: hypothetical protein EDX89_20315 [Acidobacteriota bacterium]MCE7960227.1 hypothetical protein [Acidobacteria bacterium ACB2]MDL1948266.1 hypothetical protein [Acidobacteria bacterium ACD]
MVRAPVYPLTGGGPAALLVLGLLGTVPFGGIAGWLLLVFLCALVVRDSIRGRDAFPGLAALRGTPDPGGLWVRALASTTVVLSPVLAALALAMLAASFPEEGPLRAAAGIAIPAGAFLGFVGVLFVPAALVLAVSDPEPFAILQPGRIRGVTRSLAAATVVSGFGAFFLLLALGVVNKLAPTTVARGLDMAILSGLFFVIARLTGLGARSRVPLA